MRLNPVQAVILLLLVGTLPLHAQITWTKYGGNSVIRTGYDGSWDWRQAFYPVVVYRDSLFEMFYSGDNNTTFQIGRASSRDGAVWEKDAFNPVFANGNPTSWEKFGSWVPRIVFDGSNYQMLYQGAGGPVRFGAGAVWQIGLATSEDGWSWKRYPTNPVIRADAPGTWKSDHVGTNALIFDGTKYHLWFEGITGTWPGITDAIGYATSADGVHWEEYAGNPVLTSGPVGSWDQNGVGYAAAVVRDSDFYHMWYTGGTLGDIFATTGIGYAVSPDGIHWKKYPGNPVLTAGGPGSWEQHVFGPTVVVRDSVFMMWYCGQGPYFSEIGLATSIRAGATITVDRHASDFQNVSPGTMSEPAEITVSNWGFTPLVLTSLSHRQSEFTLSAPAFPLTIPPYRDTVLTVTFAPSVPGVISRDTLTIASNDRNRPAMRVALRGRASGPVLKAERGGLYVLAENQTRPQVIELEPGSGAILASAGLTPSAPVNLHGLAFRHSDECLYAGSARGDSTVVYRISAAWGDFERFATIPVAGLASMAFGPDDRLYCATRAGDLFRVSLAGGQIERLGNTGTVLTGLSFSPATHQLWASAHDSLMILDTATAKVEFIGRSAWDVKHTSIAFGPAGTLYGLYDALLIRLDKWNAAPTSIGALPFYDTLSIATRDDIVGDAGDEGTPLPVSAELFQNHPNPFNPTTTIQLTVEERGWTTVKVFDVLGREVANLLNEVKDPGAYRLSFDGAGLASGVYLCRMTSGIYNRTRRMMLVR